MGKIAKKLTDLVGNTPLLELSNYNASKGDVEARICYYRANQWKYRSRFGICGCFQRL